MGLQTLAGWGDKGEVCVGGEVLTQDLVIKQFGGPTRLSLGMIKFMINNRTDAWKSDVNFLSTHECIEYQGGLRSIIAINKSLLSQAGCESNVAC